MASVNDIQYLTEFGFVVGIIAPLVRYLKFILPVEQIQLEIILLSKSVPLLFSPMFAFCACFVLFFCLDFHSNAQ